MTVIRCILLNQFTMCLLQTIPEIRRTPGFRQQLCPIAELLGIQRHMIPFERLQEQLNNTHIPDRYLNIYHVIRILGEIGDQS